MGVLVWNVLFFNTTKHTATYDTVAWLRKYYQSVSKTATVG